MRKPGYHAPSEQFCLRHSRQPVFDSRHRTILTQPRKPIERLQVQRQRVAPQGLLPRRIVLLLEVRHHQLPQGAVHRLAEPQAGEI